MAPQRRIDVVLDSVKRLLRIGATANLLNLLQKQHPADLASVRSVDAITRTGASYQRQREVALCTGGDLVAVVDSVVRELQL